MKYTILSLQLTIITKTIVNYINYSSVNFVYFLHQSRFILFKVPLCAFGADYPLRVIAPNDLFNSVSIKRSQDFYNKNTLKENDTSMFMSPSLIAIGTKLQENIKPILN